MKFLISFLLLAVVVTVKAYPAETNDIFYNEYTTDDSITDLWDEIKKLIQKAWKIVDEFTSELIDIFKNIEDKIEEIASIETVEESIQLIIQDLKEMFANAGSELNSECLEEQKDNIKKIAEDAHQAAMDCINHAEEKFQQIQEDALRVRSEAVDLITDTSESGTKCMVDPTTAVKCLKELSDTLKTDGKKVLTEIENVKNSAINMLESLTTCQNNVKDFFFGKIQEMYEELVKCSMSKPRAAMKPYSM